MDEKKKIFPLEAQMRAHKKQVHAHIFAYGLIDYLHASPEMKKVIEDMSRIVVDNNPGKYDTDSLEDGQIIQDYEMALNTLIEALRL